MATSARVSRCAGRMNERGSRSKVAGSRRITGFVFIVAGNKSDDTFQRIRLLGRSKTPF